MKKKIILVAVLCVILLVLYLLNSIYKFIPDGKYKKEFKINKVMPDNVKVINVQDIESTTDTWRVPAPVCMSPTSIGGDSFGNDSSEFSLAINKKYLAVSDFDANRVVIYNRNESGKWLIMKEISPPKNSIANKFGYGFAQSLDLDGDTLIIFSYIKVSNFRNKIKKDLSEIHSVNLTKEAIPEAINSKNIAIDNQKIAFITSKKNGSGSIIGIKNTPLDSVVRYLENPKDKDGDEFNVFYPGGIALKNNLLLIADYFNDNKMYAWMYDLNYRIKRPQLLTFPQVEFADTIRISDEFIVINATFNDSESYEKFDPPINVSTGGKAVLRTIVARSEVTSYPITIIKTIDSNATIIIDNNDVERTEISLDKNILAMLSFPELDSFDPNVLKIFRIDDHSIPHLLNNSDPRRVSRRGVDHAVIKDGLLATSRGDLVCIEDLSKLN